jgi:hypothetical protein
MDRRCQDIPYRVDALAYGLAGDGVTNDQPALAALVSELGAAYAKDHHPRVIECPPGVYSIRDAGTVWRNGVSLVGTHPGATRFVLSNPGRPDDPTPLAFFTEEHGASRDNPLVDCRFASFEIDGSGVQLAEYDVQAKGLGLQYALRSTFRDLYIHDTAATGLGCDFLQDSIIDGVTVAGAGRMVRGVQPGGAGIGIGIGGWGDVERLAVTNCSTVGNGRSGIFVELQTATWRPPRGILVADCHSMGNQHGIADWGADGMLVSNCILIDNFGNGFDVSASGTTGIAGCGGRISGCVIDDNLGDGICLSSTPGPYAIANNRISRNGRYGYHHRISSRPRTTNALVVQDNDIWNNGLDGIRIDASLVDPYIAGNRIYDNGQRCGPACSGGEGVRYTTDTLTDPTANWPPNAHRGKRVTAGQVHAKVRGNTTTTLYLAAVRSNVKYYWTGRTPENGTEYHLAEAPAIRAGITVNATVDQPTIRHNRIWAGRQQQPTQTQDVAITVAGVVRGGHIEDGNGNNIVGRDDRS